MNPLYVEELLRSYLNEDLGRVDLTTEGVYRGERVRAKIVAKEDGILAGLPFAARTFKLLGEVKLSSPFREGDAFRAGDAILQIEGSAKAVLSAERVALNILQRLSGIATKTKRMVSKIADLPVKLLDTRKTTPGFRLFEKYAVKVGGGENHRYALYDMVLIKDNHVKIAGSITEAVRRVRELIPPVYKIEVEVQSLDQLAEAAKLDVDVVMLDNFTPEEVKKAVELLKSLNPTLKVEVSGGVNEENLREYALSGCDYISSGAIIHSARWIDLSLRVEEAK